MYTEGQKREALRVLDECGGRVTAAMRQLGYPSRQCFYQWINQRDAAHVRTNGRPFSHYSEQTKDDAIRLLDSGMDAKDIADHLGVLNAAIVHNWARAAKRKADRMDDGEIEHRSIENEGRAYDGFDGDLEEKVRQLELENDILRGVVDALKGASLGSLTNREKTILIDHLRQKTDHRLSELTDFLRISKSSYEYQRKAIAKGDKYAEVRPLVVGIFEDSNRTRGYRYVTHELRELDDPVVVSEKVVRRIMAEEGCRVIYLKKAKRYSSYKGEISDAPENLVKRNFHADAPDELWLSDITEFGIPAGKCYLSPVLDCFDGKLVSWAVSTSPNAELANRSLKEACSKLRAGKHPVIHTDRGCHYRWPGWIAICDENELVRSMSRKACSPDNSAMEGFFGRMKNEFFFHRDWEGVTMEEFVSMLNAYLVFYNKERPKESLGWMSPNDFRRSLGLAA
jgi:transposase InsO family protein/transposase-like protein